MIYYNIDWLEKFQSTEYLNSFQNDFKIESAKERTSSALKQPIIKRDPISILNTKISELQESIPDKITKAKNSLNDKNAFDQLKTNSQSYSIIIGSIVNIYGNCVRREFEIENMNQIYEYVYTFFYRLGFNCVCSFVVTSPKAELLKCGKENYFTTVKKYGLKSGVDLLIAQVKKIIYRICRICHKFYCLKTFQSILINIFCSLVSRKLDLLLMNSTK